MAQRGRGRRAQRKICFYRIDAGLDDAGRPLPFDPLPYLTKLDNLPFRKVGGRYSPDSDGYFCSWVDKCSSPFRLKYSKICWDEITQEIEHNGNLSPLPIGDNDGVVDTIHLVLYPAPPYWLVGCEYKWAGPRIARLAAYLAEKTQCPGLEFVPLIGDDTVSKLTNFQDLRLLTLRIHPAQIGNLPKPPRNSQVEEFLDAAQRLGEPEIVEVTLRSSHKTGRKLSLDMLRYFKELLYSPYPGKGAIEGKVRGFNLETGRVDVVELLNVQITETVSLQRAGPRRSPSDATIYSAIEQAIIKRLPELTAAAGITVGTGGNDESHNSVA